MKMEFDEDLMIPDKSLSINEGAIVVTGWQSCTDKSSFTHAILGKHSARNIILTWIRRLNSIRKKSRMFYFVGLMEKKSRSIIKDNAGKGSMTLHLMG